MILHVKRASASIVLALLVASCTELNMNQLDIIEVSGVPVLVENGMPYFTRFVASDHQRLDLAGAWKFMPDPGDKGETEGWHKAGFDDSGWHDHPVPGCWNVQKKEWLHYVGAAWYRTQFLAPASMEGNFNRLVFDGVDYVGEVWLNGEFMGMHSGGHVQWCLDVTDKIDFEGVNVLAVKVDNRRGYDTLPPFVREGRPFGMWPYGGITRSAVIESGPHTTLCKLAVSTDHEGRIKAQGVIYNHGPWPASARVTVSLKELDGKRVALLAIFNRDLDGVDLAALDMESQIEGVDVWSPAHPENRYLLEVEVATGAGWEIQAVEIGFRSFEFRGTEARLNGEKTFLRGINRHEDDPDQGKVQTKEGIEQDIALIRELHADFVRTAHYPDDPRWLDACDRAGIMIETEIPLYQVGWGLKSLRAAEKQELYRNAARQLIEMIERDRNHPSVVIWGIGDECFTLFPSIERLYRALYDVAKRFDPERPVTFAIFVIPYGVTPALEISAEVADVIFVNQYLGWYFREPGEVDGLLDRMHEKWPDKPIMISEMGGGAVKGLEPGGRLYPVGYGNSRDFSEDFQLDIYRTQLPILKSKPYVVGIMPWVFADFRDDKRSSNPVPDMNLKGLVTYDRQKKQAFGLVSDFFAGVEKEYGQ